MHGLLWNRCFCLNHVATLRVPTEIVRFDGCCDHLILHIVFPEGSALGHFQVRFHSLLSSQRVVKRAGCYDGLILEASVVIVTLEVLNL